MASIKKIKPGQTLYEVKRNTGLASFTGTWSVWPVFVKEVNIEEQYIIASWNHNPPKKMYLPYIKKLMVSRPN